LTGVTKPGGLRTFPQWGKQAAKEEKGEGSSLLRERGGQMTKRRRPGVMAGWTDDGVRFRGKTKEGEHSASEGEKEVADQSKRRDRVQVSVASATSRERLSRSMSGTERTTSDWRGG